MQVNEIYNYVFMIWSHFYYSGYFLMKSRAVILVVRILLLSKHSETRLWLKFKEYAKINLVNGSNINGLRLS